LAFVDGVRCEPRRGRTEFFAEPEGSGRESDRSEGFTDSSLAYEECGRRMEAVRRKAEEFTLDGLAGFCHAADGVAQDLVYVCAAFDKFTPASSARAHRPRKEKPYLKMSASSN
jgi:hypothetical protein